MAARQLLESSGVPVVPGELVNSADDAVAAATRLGYPVVLKIQSDQITHKSDIGGVALRLTNEAEVRAAFDKVYAAGKAVPDAVIDGVLVAPMRSGGLELLAGVTKDPTFGPVMAVGLGGVWVEIMQDTSLRVLPVDAEEVKNMFGELKAAPLLQGARGSLAGRPRRAGRGRRQAGRRRDIAGRLAGRAGSQPAVGQRQPDRSAGRPGHYRVAGTRLRNPRAAARGFRVPRR